MAQTPSQEFHGLSLHVTVTVAPENVDKFLDHLRPAYEAVAAEPECTFFEVYISSDQPGVLRWVEGWSKDRKWLLEVRSPFNISFILFISLLLAMPFICL